MTVHSRWIGAAARLGQAEAADRKPFRQRRQPSLLLLLAAVGMDGEHHQAALDRGEAADAGVAPLQLLADEAVGDVAEAGAAVAFQVATE